MLELNVVNLIQASTVTVCLLGSVLLWQKAQTRPIACLFGLTAVASLINILEETGLTRDIILISPIFIMLFGPATYLAIKAFITRNVTKFDYWHLAPVVLFFIFTPSIQVTIAIGTVWRLAYSVMSMLLLLKYKKQLEQQRSDSGEYSFAWLIWVIAVTAAFNLIDLLRLNVQPLISVEVNVAGQGVNNLVWLVAVMYMLYKFLTITQIPLINLQADSVKPNQKKDTTEEAEFEQYQSLFVELDSLVKQHQWFLKPRLTLSDISEFTGMQTRDISRVINLIAKKSFNEYINDFRVEFVCEQLKKAEIQSLTDLYERAGFSSKTSFNTVFKQTTGVTPSLYKSSLKSIR